MKAIRQTQVVVTFQFDTNRESELILILQLVFSLARLLGAPIRFGIDLALDTLALAADLWQALLFIGKVYQIAITSLRWGFGL